MKPQISYVANRQFWFGVLATIIVVILVATGVPNRLRARMPSKETKQEQLMGVRLQPTGRVEGYLGRDTLMRIASNAAADDERKMVRSASVDMIVKSPKETSDKIRLLAEQSGGFLVSSEIYGGENASSASLTVRIPVGKFEQVRTQISNLGLRGESEKLQAEDVTKQYVDLSARLRNFRAQESQYLGILKQAKTIKDTLEVSDKLNEVRAEIEQQQAEFDVLSKQVETVALTISLSAEADAKVLGLHWRPLYQLKVAARDGLTELEITLRLWRHSSSTFRQFSCGSLPFWLAQLSRGESRVGPGGRSSCPSQRRFSARVMCLCLLLANFEVLLG